MSKRIKNINDLNDIFSTVDKIKSSKMSVQKAAKRVYVVTSEDSWSELAEILKDSDAIMLQGLYGSSLWTQVEHLEGQLAGRSQFVKYDFYNLFRSLTQDIVINNSSVFHLVIPAIRDLGEALMKSSYGLGKAIYVAPTYGREQRSWFVKSTPMRIRTCVFVMDNIDFMRENHKKNPQYFEAEKSYEQYLKDSLSGVMLPEFSEGFDNIVILLNARHGPILVDGGGVSVHSVKSFYSGSIVEHI